MNKRVMGTMFTLVLVALMALAPVAQGKTEWDREFDVEPGQKIELKMPSGGSLEVEGWDRDVVRIVCTEGVNDLDDYTFEVDETRAGLRFFADVDDRHIQSTGLLVKLMVPSEFDIETNSGGGHICIANVTGDFRGETAGGHINLESVSGTADLHTGGGIVRIKDSDLDGKVTTGGGGGLVRAVTGNVVARSGGSIVSYENVRDRNGDIRGPGDLSTKGATVRTILRATAGGVIRVDDAPEGAVVETGGGDVIISGASRFVRAKTGGGDMEIEVTDGSVKASTGAGDVEVVVLDGFGDGEDGIEISTGHGSIDIVVPEDASMEFDLDVAYTRNSSREFKITSDIDLDREHTSKWKREHGSNYWKHIYGTASVNGGKHRIVVKSVNGNVRIRTR